MKDKLYALFMQLLTINLTEQRKRVLANILATKLMDVGYLRCSAEQFVAWLLLFEGTERTYLDVCLLAADKHFSEDVDNPLDKHAKM